MWGILLLQTEDGDFNINLISWNAIVLQRFKKYFGLWCSKLVYGGIMQST